MSYKLTKESSGTYGESRSDAATAAFEYVFIPVRGSDACDSKGGFGRDLGTVYQAVEASVEEGVMIGKEMAGGEFVVGEGSTLVGARRGGEGGEVDGCLGMAVTLL